MAFPDSKNRLLIITVLWAVQGQDLRDLTLQLFS